MTVALLTKSVLLVSVSLIQTPDIRGEVLFALSCLFAVYNPLWEFGSVVRMLHAMPVSYVKVPGFQVLAVPLVVVSST